MTTKSRPKRASVTFRLRRAASALRGTTSLLVALALVSAVSMAAQSIQYFGAFTSYSQNIVTYPQGIVADASGNLYISGTFNLTYIPVDANGTPQTANSVLINSTGSNVLGMAIDSANNIYRADVGSQNVQKFTYVGNHTNFANSNAPTYIGSGWSEPSAVTVDASLNVYVLDAGTGSIVELTPNGGSYTQTTIFTDARLQGTTGLSIDSAGNFYVASGPSYGPASGGVSNATAAVYKITNSGGTYTMSTIGSGWTSPSGTSVDSQGNVWVADYSANEISVLIPSGGSYTQVPYESISGIKTLTTNKAGQLYGISYAGSALIWAGGSAPHNMGGYNIGTSSATVPVTVSFQASTTLTGYSVVTQGVTGKDFKDAGGSTCTATSYSAGNSCVINVSFTPQAVGMRTGAIQLLGTGGTVLSTNYLYGIGLGPIAALAPAQMGTYVGTGTPCAGGSSPCGDGGTATAANLDNPNGVTFDNWGNLYIADSNSNRVRMVTPGGAISTVAGNGSSCTPTTAACGDGGPATSAQLSFPYGVAVDGAGNLYISDVDAQRIRMVAAGTGIISTVAGTGVQCSSPTASCGDGGLAASAQLNLGGFSEIAVDGMGHLLIPDGGDNRIRSVDLSTGIITTIAGTGTSCGSPTSACGDGGAATSAQFNLPGAIGVDTQGNYFVADQNDNRVREISALTGTVTTVAGTGNSCSSGTAACGDGGAATSADLNYPVAIATDAANNIYIADSNDNRIRMVSVATGNITTVAGNGNICSPSTAACGDGGVATSATMNDPFGVAVDGAGNVYAASAENRVRQINVASGGSISFASSNVGTQSTDSPQSVMLTNIGNADLSIAVPGTGTNPLFPAGFANDGSSTCPQLSTSSSVGTLAANATCTIGVDFIPTVAGTNSGNVVLTDNNLGVANSTQSFPVSGTGTSSTISFLPGPTGTPGTPQTGAFTIPGGKTVTSVMVVTQGVQNLDFTADPSTTCTAGSSGSCNVVVDFTPKAPGLRLGAVIITLSDGSTLTQFISGTGVGPLAAYLPGSQTTVGTSLSGPQGVYADGVGNVYIANTMGNSVIKVPWNGSSYGPQVTLTTNTHNPGGVFVDGAGNVFIADYSNNQVDEIPWNGSSYGAQTTVGTGISEPNSVTVDGSGNVYIASEGNSQIVKVPWDAASNSFGTQQNIGSGWNQPTGVAADGSGNVYVAEYYAGKVYQLPASGSGYGAPVAIGAGWTHPFNVSVDNSGNVYVVDAGTNQVSALYWNGSSFGNQTVIASSTANGLGGATGVSVDGMGNVYIADQGSSRIVKLSDSTGASVTFNTSTVVGTADTADGQQSVTLQNLGNAPLNIASINFPAAGFSSGSNTTCATGNLAQGATCIIGVNFDPTVAGSNTGNVVVTNNSLNVTGSTQNIAASGTGLPNVTQLAFNPPAASAVTVGGNAGLVTVDELNSSNAVVTTAGDSITLTVTGPNGYTKTYTATAVSGVATFDLTGASLTTPGAYIYTATGATFTVVSTETVTKATPTITAGTSQSPVFIGTAVTYTASVTGTAPSAPTGSVTFYDGATALGTVVLNNSGVAVLTATPSTAATHAVTAVYSGDTLYNTATSNTVAELAQDFSVAVAGGGSGSISVLPGSTATYPLVVTPLGGSTFPAAISLAVTGAPSGATVTLSPTSVAAGAAATNLTLTVVTPNTPVAANQKPDIGSKLAPLSLGLLLLPLAGFRRFRKRWLRGLAVILFLAGGLAAMTGLSGCSAPSGYFGQAPKSITMTVTGTSGSLTHSTSVTLNVQ